MTAAAWRTRLSSAASRSMRAMSTPSTVSGTADPGAGLPPSATARASSSVKKGLPSAFATIISTVGSSTSAAPITSRARLRLSWADSGWSATWVA